MLPNDANAGNRQVKIPPLCERHGPCAPDHETRRRLRSRRAASCCRPKRASPRGHELRGSIRRPMSAESDGRRPRVSLDGHRARRRACREKVLRSHAVRSSRPHRPANAAELPPEQIGREPPPRAPASSSLRARRGRHHRRGPIRGGFALRNSAKAHGAFSIRLAWP